MLLIPYGRQNIDESDVEAVVEVLRSDWLTQGPAVECFERLVAESCGAQYGVAACNATAALHLACLALDVGPGDRIWTSPNTFVASANCGIYCGAVVDFVDIDPLTYNMSVQALAAKLEAASRIGKLPKVVVPVHFSGQPCDMPAISKLAKMYGFSVIEDASHAIGAEWCNEKVGACIHSDITVFSFHPVKIVTTGEGGMALTSRNDIYRKLQLLRTHGITREPELMSGDSEGPWYYQQVGLGYNYRITDIQAALGSSQVRRLREFIDRRRQLAARYDKGLQNLPLITPGRAPNASSAWHLYVIQLQLEKLRSTRREIFEALRAAGIQVNVHYIPVHLQPFYRQQGFNPGDFPNAERYYSRAITLPLYFGLSDEQQDFVIRTLAGCLK